jgi:VanZ family protein
MERPTDASTAWRRVALTGGVLFVSTVTPAKRRDPPEPPPYGIDKVAHAVAHAWFAVALLDAFEATGWSREAPVAAVGLSASSGVALELLQRWVPGRRFESGDVVAGVVGSVVAVGAARRCDPSTRTT